MARLEMMYMMGEQSVDVIESVHGASEFLVSVHFPCLTVCFTTRRPS